MTVASVDRAEPSHRLFFGSWPTDAEREALGAVLPRLEWASGGRRVPIANYHLTLAFLGTVAAARLDAVRAAAAQVKSSAAVIQLDRIEYWAKPQLLCLVASETPLGLRLLVQELWQALARIGFKPDVRPFKAHVTLARKVERPPASRSVSPVPWAVDRLALVESIGTPEGPAYTPLAFWPLTSSST
jgi:2'-5' RNA ligase